MFLIVLVKYIFSFLVILVIIFTGVYWKMISMKDQELFTTICIKIAYCLNLTTCYISIIYFNIVGRSVIRLIFESYHVHNLMETIGIPYSHANMYRVTFALTILIIPILLIIFAINFTLAEIMGVVYPYFIRVMYMSTAAQFATGGLQLTFPFKKLLKNIKRHSEQYTPDEQIKMIVTFTKLLSMFQKCISLQYEIYGVLFFVNIYANAFEMAFIIGYIYVHGLQDTFILSWLIMYIPGNLIHLYLYTIVEFMNKRVSAVNIYLMF